MHVDGLIRDAAQWRAAVRGRAPSNHRLLEVLEALLGEPGPIGSELRARIEEAWAGRSFAIFYDRPLLFVAALRREALVHGEGHPLFAALGAATPDPDAVSRLKLLDALMADSVWASLRTRYVQTNETSRAVTWLWPAALAGCGPGGRPLALVEVGAAAGLNLVAGALPAPWTDELGAPLPVATGARTVLRRGLDLRPLDAGDEEAVTWMRACIWAGERERLERFDASVAAFRADPPELVALSAAGAAAELERVTAAVPEDALVLAFQTVVRDYLDRATDDAYERGLRGWLASLPRRRALWAELEIARSGADRARPASITVHLPDGQGGVTDLVLGCTSYHPADVVVDRAAAGALRGDFSAGR